MHLSNLLNKKKYFNSTIKFLNKSFSPNKFKIYKTKMTKNIRKIKNVTVEVRDPECKTFYSKKKKTES